MQRLYSNIFKMQLALSSAFMVKKVIQKQLGFGLAPDLIIIGSLNLITILKT